MGTTSTAPTSITEPSSKSEQTSNMKLGTRKLSKHYKHKKFSKFYKTLASSKGEEISEEDRKLDLLTSLRVQLTNAALNDDKLKAKANRIPLYQPRKKVNEASLKQLYQSKVFRPDSLNEEHKRKLDTELQNVLK